MSVRALGIALLVGGCSGEPASDESSPTGPTAGPTTPGAVFGPGHDVSESLEVVVKASDGLDRPQDLAINPEVASEAWIVSRRDDSVTIVNDFGGADQVSEHIVDPYALHFMELVSSIAFGAPGTFGTCQDSTNTYNDQGAPNYFMGPTLWSSDREIFGKSNPEAVDYLTDLFGFPVDLGSHLDMLHESPECKGIAWDHDNVYWVFDGYNQAIVRYDFREDHGVGYDDHSDGIIDRWVEGEVQPKEGVVSHLILGHETGLLYIADTGNNRIAVLDTASGSQGESLPRKEPGTQHHAWVGGDLSTLVEGEELGMMAPSGIELVGDVLLVTDNGTGRIHAFDLAGNELDWAETGRAGDLAGVFATSLDEIWIVDEAKDQVLRLAR